MLPDNINITLQCIFMGKKIICIRLLLPIAIFKNPSYQACVKLSSEVHAYQIFTELEQNRRCLYLQLMN